MSLITDAIDRLLAPLFEKIKQVFAPFGKLVDFITKFWTSLTSIGSRIRDLVNTIVSEVDEWRNFKESVSFRTKLISLPAAVDHVQDFIAEVRTAWAAVLDLIQQLKSKFETTGNPTEEAEQALADIESSGFKSILEKFPKLFKGLEKLVGFLAILLDAFESISAAVDDLQAIVNVARDFRNDIETGGPFFLKQSNPRRTDHLDDGTPIKIRVGNLHK